MSLNTKTLLTTDAYSSAMAGMDDFKSRVAYKDAWKDTDAMTDGAEREAKEQEIAAGIISNDTMLVGKFVDYLGGAKAPLGDKLPTIREAFNDFISIKDFPNVIGPAIEVYMKSYQMPQILISSQIFQEVPYNGQRDTVNVKSVGPVQIEEVGRSEAYPEISNSIIKAPPPYTATTRMTIIPLSPPG